MSQSKVPIISICIPTYRRPELLDRCLKAIEKQVVNDFQIEVVVVDNDKYESARVVVEKHKSILRSGLLYAMEPVQNISMARNRAIAESTGDFIAFIDDDEFPEPAWLSELYSVCNHYNSDGVLGPVLPQFIGTPPGWLIKSGLCLRESFPTGTFLKNPKYMRTGNVLLSRQVLKDLLEPFNPKFGRTGGEDTLFFSALLRRNYSFVWCNEASVYEEVPTERQTKGYYIQRALMRGVNNAGRERLISKGTIKSLLAIVVYSLMMPFLLLAGQHLSMKYLVKICDHLSKLLTHIRIRLVRERNF